MLSSHQVPVIVSVKKTTATKSLFAKILGLSAHIGILYIGTTIAEYAWRLWGACSKSSVKSWLGFIEL